MIGMLQIVILMGCIYLVMKIIAIYQAGNAVPPERRKSAALLAGLALVIGLGGAALCLWLMIEQSASVSEIGSGMPY